MQNGITRLYNAIWYKQLGRALQHADTRSENAETDDTSYGEDIRIAQDDTQHSRRGNRLIEDSNVWRDTDSDNKIADSIFQKILIENQDKVRKAYEKIIKDKQNNIQRYKEVIGHLIALVESKKSSLTGIMDDIDKLEQMKEATVVKSKVISQELRLDGLSEEGIKQHPEYVRCVSSYNDSHSTLEEKNARITKLEKDIKRAQADIDNYKTQITALHRDLEKTKTEQSEAIADLIAAREQEEIKGLLSGINDD